MLLGESRRPGGRTCTDPCDLAEEVIRLEGYENVPVRTPRAAAGRGLTDRQRLRRTIGRVAGLARLRRGAQHAVQLRRRLRPAAAARRTTRGAVRRSVANPLNDDEPLMRTTLLPGLLRVLARNIGRGFTDVGLFETGPGLPAPGPARATAPILRVDRGPDGRRKWPQLEAALPDQPLHTRRWSSRASASWTAGGARAARRAGRTPSRRPARSCATTGSRSRSGPSRRAVAPGPLRRAVRPGRGRAGVAGRVRGRAASAGHHRVRAAAADLRDGDWTCR